MSGYDRILRNLGAITRALKLTHGAQEKLTLHYKQNEWIDITENPREDVLVTLALMRIKQDPNQYDQFVSMLRDIEGMDLIVNTITSGVTTLPTPSPSTSSPSPLTNMPPAKRLKTDHSHVSPHVTSSCHLPPSTSLVTHSPSVTTVPPVLSRYADFLRAVYANSPVAKSDKLPHTPSTVYITLALVKKEKVSRAEADKFTRLTLQGDVDLILCVKEQIEMNDILKDSKTRLVVVEGAPGIGKSTLAWELCRQWPTMESLKRFSLVVLHRLREEGVRSATDISDLFPCEDNPSLSGLVAEKIRGELGKGVLFVLDGFDELPSRLRKTEDSLIMKVIAGRLLPKATVLVTSRPSATADLQTAFQADIGKHIEVVGFSEKEIQYYVESIFKSKPETLASFNAYLSVNPVVKGMMYNPLNCAIVVEVYRETSELGKPIPHTQTQLYTELTLCLLSRYLSATGDPLARRLPDRLEDLPHDSDLYQQLVKVGRLAFEGRLREEVIFKQLPEGCSDLGLLVEHRALYTRKEMTTFNFFHLTLQEYMSAFYISQLPASEQRTLFIEHSMRVVWRFVAGLTKMHNIGWDEFKGVKNVERRDSYEYVLEGDEVGVDSYLIQCLYEAQDVQSCKSVFGLTHKLWCSSNTDYDLYALGYCISACSSAWNVTARSSSAVGLEMLGHGMKSVEYGGGSVDKLDLEL